MLGIDKSDSTYGYYYVDHASKSLFWAEDLPEIFANVRVTEKSHISVSARHYNLFCVIQWELPSFMQTAVIGVVFC